MSLSSRLGGIAENLMNRHFDSIGEGSLSVKILVAQHFPCALPSCFANHDVYVPIHAGRELSTPISGIIGDDTGDNISRYNRYLNEITAIYWAGTHYAELGNPDYIGFNHYRRYLEWSYSVLDGRVIIANRVPLLKNLYDTYAAYHYIADLDAFLRHFKTEFGNACPDVDGYLRSHVMYMANQFIMDRDTFFEYRGFLNRCLNVIFAMLASNEIKVETYSKYQSRVYSFILERMTGYFIYRARRNGNTPFVSARVRNFDIANTINGNR